MVKSNLKKPKKGNKEIFLEKINKLNLNIKKLKIEIKKERSFLQKGKNIEKEFIRKLEDMKKKLRTDEIIKNPKDSNTKIFSDRIVLRKESEKLDGLKKTNSDIERDINKKTKRIMDSEKEIIILKNKLTIKIKPKFSFFWVV